MTSTCATTQQLIISITNHLNHQFLNVNFALWRNQHAYPYYPRFIELLDDLNINSEEKDPYVEYILRFRNRYNDLPCIIAEVGLSTTYNYGVASYDNIYGHVTELKQGILLRDIILRVIIFQLQGGLYMFFITVFCYILLFTLRSHGTH
eukprot:244705_1